MEGSSTMDQVVKNTQENMSWLSIWWQQFVDASTVIWFVVGLFMCTE
jgi:hypothetical protein